MVHHFPGFDRSNAEYSQQSGGSFAVVQLTSGDHCPDWIDRHWLGRAAALARTAVDHWRADLNHGAASGSGFEFVWPGRDFCGNRELVAPQIFSADPIRFGG